MITFTLAGVKYLVQKRVAGALQLLKRMVAFLAGKDKRWPNTPDDKPKMDAGRDDNKSPEVESPGRKPGLTSGVHSG